MPTKIFAVCLLLMFAAPARGSQNANEWVSYTSEEGRFSARFPQQPKPNAQEATSSTGEKFTQYMVQASDSDSIYMLGYFDVAPNMFFSFEKARDGAIEATKGTLLNETEITLGINPGQELLILVKDEEVEYLMHSRMYEIGSRIYIVQHIFKKSSDSKAIAEKSAKFFDSFKATTVK